MGEATAERCPPLSERKLSENCQILTKSLKDVGVASANISINNLGEKEGCVIDISDPTTKRLTETKDWPMQYSSSIHVNDQQKWITMEITVPNCETYQRMPPHFLVGPMYYDICQPGCEIKMVHVHSGRIPNTHFHVECDVNKFANPQHCVNKIGAIISKLHEFTKETCE